MVQYMVGRWRRNQNRDSRKSVDYPAKVRYLQYSYYAAAHRLFSRDF